MRRFEVSFASGRPPVVVSASSEADARREAMLAVYGPAPSKVVPYAPNYDGLGCYPIPLATFDNDMPSIEDEMIARRM